MVPESISTTVNLQVAVRWQSGHFRLRDRSENDGGELRSETQPMACYKSGEIDDNGDNWDMTANLQASDWYCARPVMWLKIGYGRVVGLGWVSGQFDRFLSLKCEHASPFLVFSFIILLFNHLSFFLIRYNLFVIFSLFLLKYYLLFENYKYIHILHYKWRYKLYSYFTPFWIPKKSLIKPFVCYFLFISIKILFFIWKL